MLPSPHHAPTEQTPTVGPDLTLYASLELSRAKWLITCLLPERDRLLKYWTAGGDGAGSSVCWSAFEGLRNLAKIT